MVYFPRIEGFDNTPVKCPGCGKWHVNLAGDMEHVSCTVFHAPGSCCHFGESEVPAPTKEEE